MHAPILFVLDKGFKVGPFDVFQFSLARLAIEVEEEHDRREGAVNRPRLVVRPDLVTEVVREVLFFGDVERRESCEDAGDTGWCRLLVVRFFRIAA